MKRCIETGQKYGSQISRREGATQGGANAPEPRSKRGVF
ncbi:unnamed protein product [Gemmata massiliana]|uniref:Uncharacterized protein n=1 Tax=Gemmata massiliana TaxID=1210884 RepID=A0A6P2CZG4_9BACT|nr:unnamed protein product [Gemmata massiliana]